MDTLTQLKRIRASAAGWVGGLVIASASHTTALAQTAAEPMLRYIFMEEFRQACSKPDGTIDGTKSRFAAMGWPKTTNRDYRAATLPDDVLKRTKVVEAYAVDDDNGFRIGGVGKARFDWAPSVYCHVVSFGTKGDVDGLISDFTTIYPGAVERKDKSDEIRLTINFENGDGKAVFQAVDFDLDNGIWGFFVLSVVNKNDK